ncbi:MAG: Cys-tRNA(Pro) deacylase [Nocardioidaceae bacterium]
MARPRTSGSTPATLALTRAGVRFSEHTYDHDPSAASYGLEAAAALGLDPHRVLKTLLVSVDGRLVVAVVPVAGQLDLKAVAAAVGGKRAAMADPADAERATGYVVGGISPVGQRRRHPTVVDSSVLALDEVYVSGGRRGLDVGLDPADLVRLTGATAAPIGRPGRG